MTALPVFEELFQEIVTTPAPVLSVEVSPWQHRSRRPLLLVSAAIVVLIAVIVPLSLTSGGGLTHAATTPFRAGYAFSPVSKGSSPHTASGLWQLMSAESTLDGTWQQNTAGPPPGTLTCATVSTCYVMAGKYASPKASSPLQSESLYVTDDLGLNWLVLPMPNGFEPSTLLACSGPSACAAGGRLNDRPILISTTDGGHQWTTTPLTNVPGELLYLACSSATSCNGIAGPAYDNPNGVGLTRGEAPDESFVTTEDGGAQWTSSALPSGDFVDGLACQGSGQCLLMGTNISSGDFNTIVQPSFALLTSDAGTTWSDGTVPAGFTVSTDDSLSCADAENCLVLGTIPIKVTNPPQCSSHSIPLPQGVKTPPTTTLPLSPVVAAVAGPEGVIATQANDEEGAEGYGFSCNPGAVSSVSDIAATSDGGRSWTPETLPSDVPAPQLSDISCATSTVCWASGSESVPITIAKTSDGGSSMLLGTTDGGLSWSKMTFTVPSGAPNAYGQSYLSIASVDCPAANACIALGAAAQSSATAPVYSFVSEADS